MKAFVEILSCIVRFGEECDGYGQPYEGAVAVSCNAGKAEVKALTQPQGGLKHSHASSVVTALQSLGLTVTWERFKNE